MRAVVVSQFTSPDTLRLGEAPEPAPGDSEVLIEVKAAGCNFFDSLLVQGRYQVKPPFPFSPGGEVAGVVRAVGAAVENFEPGDRVMAHVGHGGFAELVCAPHRATFRIPATMPFEEAAAFPIVYGTAYAGLVTRGGAGPGESILVTAAAGGVGLAAVQVGKALGATVIGAASKDKLSIVHESGADHAVDYRAEGWGERVREITHGKGADVILENVGGDVFETCLRSIAWAGRLVVCGFSSGTIPEVKLNRVLLKHVALVGLHFGPMFEHEPGVLREAYERLLSWYERGLVRPHVSRVLPLSDAAAALTALKSRDTVGKVVLVV